MHYLIIALVALVAAAAVLVAAFGFAGRQTATSVGPPPVVRPAVDPAAPPSRERLAAMLRELARREVPSQLAVGAMCYEVAGPPLRSEHVCPECGEKTLYASGPDRPAEARAADWELLSLLEWGLVACRRRVQEIRGLDVALDETQFCRRCSPDAPTPRLGLVVRHHGEGEPHRVWGVGAEDLVLLGEFLAGKDRHTDFYDHETPLGNHLPRIEQLLGVGAKGAGTAQ